MLTLNRYRPGRSERVGASDRFRFWPFSLQSPRCTFDAFPRKPNQLKTHSTTTPPTIKPSHLQLPTVNFHPDPPCRLAGRAPRRRRCLRRAGDDFRLGLGGGRAAAVLAGVSEKLLGHEPVVSVKGTGRPVAPVGCEKALRPHRVSASIATSIPPLRSAHVSGHAHSGAAPAFARASAAKCTPATRNERRAEWLVWDSDRRRPTLLLGGKRGAPARLLLLRRGGRAWSIAPVLKTGVPAVAPGVRIPPPPLLF